MYSQQENDKVKQIGKFDKLANWVHGFSRFAAFRSLRTGISNSIQIELAAERPAALAILHT
jgi:hypothetical protein